MPVLAHFFIAKSMEKFSTFKKNTCQTLKNGTAPTTTKEKIDGSIQKKIRQ